MISYAAMAPMLTRLAILVVTTGLSIVGVLFARRRIPHEVLAQNQTFTGVTYSIVGAVYGVYLAFTIVVVWQQFDQAEQNTVSEAVHLSETWRDVQVLPEVNRLAVQSRLMAYSESVVEREWPSMASGKGADPDTARRYEDLWQALYAARAQATNPGEAIFFTEAVREMNTIGVQRRMRLLASDSTLPVIMWALLIGGGIVTVGFTYIIGSAHAWIQLWVTGTLTALIVFSLILVAALQHPFGGDISVKPEAFEGVVKSFHERMQNASAPR